jgi:predicted ATP-grasp superfamily ATP-dependent carboligase
VAIAGFEGWNDAGEAASGVVNHLGIAWQATPIGAIDPEDFYDFQVNRPVIDVEDGHTQRLIWPTTRISLARASSPAGSLDSSSSLGSLGPLGPDGEPAPPTGLSRDVILVHGIEPNMRWRAFTEELVQGLESLGVNLVILLGALLADSPHTRPVPVSVGSSNATLAADALRGVGRVDYKGPTGIVGVLQHACAGAGIPAVSLWAQVPHYVAQPPSPKATLALLRGVEDVLDAPLPLADLPEEARAWEHGVDELAQSDSEVADYVRTLEEAKDAMDLPEASGDAIAREFERYFRRHGNGEARGPGPGS